MRLRCKLPASPTGITPPTEAEKTLKEALQWTGELAHAGATFKMLKRDEHPGGNEAFETYASEVADTLLSIHDFTVKDDKHDDPSEVLERALMAVMVAARDQAQARAEREAKANGEDPDFASVGDGVSLNAMLSVLLKDWSVDELIEAIKETSPFFEDLPKTSDLAPRRVRGSSCCGSHL